MGKGEKRAHFVLVHGSCHGGWCWYKVATLLRAAGHRVTAPDLAASGVDARRLDEVGTFSEYARPLMEVMSALPPGERVVLVGHSYGGLVVALAANRFPEKVAAVVFLTAFMPDTTFRLSYVMEEVVLVGHSYGGLVVALAANRFPEKVSAVVFLTAFMPDTTFRLSYVMEEYVKKFPLPWMDTQAFPLSRGPNRKPISSFLFGREFTSSKLYQLCPPQDITLGLSLMRAGSLFLEDLSGDLIAPLSETKYGSVKKVYIGCGQDRGIPKDFQLWMTENYVVDEVKVVEGADHMPMLSTPAELCRSLEDVAVVYA